MSYRYLYWTLRTCRDKDPFKQPCFDCGVHYSMKMQANWTQSSYESPFGKVNESKWVIVRKRSFGSVKKQLYIVIKHIPDLTMSLFVPLNETAGAEVFMRPSCHAAG